MTSRHNPAPSALWIAHMAAFIACAALGLAIDLSLRQTIAFAAGVTVVLTALDWAIQRFWR